MTIMSSLIVDDLNNKGIPALRFAAGMPLATARWLLAGITATAPVHARANENGGLAILPGNFASFEATPREPGLTLPQIYYHTSAWSDNTEQVLSAKGKPVTVRIKSNINEFYFIFAPNYTFTDKVLGAQANVELAGFFGHSNNFLTAETASGSTPNTTRVNGQGDMSLAFSLRWNAGVHNFMTYIQPYAPIGDYQQGRQMDIGGQNWALDGGGGYTYFDPRTGWELSATLGAIYNFENPETGYHSGVDLHLSWGSGHMFLHDSLFVGVAGYFTNQITSDTLAGNPVPHSNTRAIALGPQAQYGFKLFSKQAYLLFRSYGGISTQNKPIGFENFLILSISL